MISPEDIIKGRKSQKYQQANRAYQNDIKMLQSSGLPREIMQQETSKLVQKYQGMKLQIDSEAEDQLFQIQNISKLVGTGQLPEEAGQEASFRRTVGGDVAGAMFEKDKGSDMLKNYATLDIHRKRIQSRLDRYKRKKDPVFTRGGKWRRMMTKTGVNPLGFVGTGGEAPSGLKVILDSRIIKGVRKHVYRDATQEEQREHANLLTQRRQLDRELSTIARGMNVDPTSIGQLGRIGAQKIARTPTIQEAGGPLQADLKKKVTPTASQTVRVQSPDGKVGTIPASQLNEALAAGYRKL